MRDFVSAEVIAAKIVVVRGKKVMLDRHLAELYGVKAIVLKIQDALPNLLSHDTL